MGYLYQGKCLDTVQQLHENVAAECPVVSGNYALQCTPSAVQIDIVATDLSTSATFASVLTPSLIPCEVSLVNQTGFMWELALILTAGFAVRAIIKAFQ